MKRTTLRTSAIALGVAAALPATAQEWNLAWGGYMNQHVAFGSTEVKGARAETSRFSIEVGADDEKETKTAHFSLVRTATAPANNTGATVRVAANASAADIRVAFGDFNPADPSANAKVTTLQVNTTTLETLRTFIERLSTAITDGAGLGNGQDIDGVNIVVIATEAEQTRIREEGSKAVNMALGTPKKHSGTGIVDDAEIHFKPSVTLENGLTFGAHVEFEGGAHQADTDESYLTISSDSLGMFIIGNENSAGYRMMVAAPSVGLGINSGSHPDFLPSFGYGWREAAGSSNTEVGGNNDIARVSYHTPNLGGLTLGVSYAPDNGIGAVSPDDAKAAPKNAGGPGTSGAQQLLIDDADIPLKDIIDLGVKFEQSLGEANVTLAARYGTGKNNDPKKKNPREIGFGAQVGFGAFTFGGAYADSERGSADKSSSGWSLGMAYDMDGPWKFGIETYQGKYDNGDKQGVSKIAASRTLGPGVVWDLYAVTASSKKASNNLAWTYVEGTGATATTETVDNVKIDGTKDVDGTLFGTSIKLTF